MISEVSAARTARLSFWLLLLMLIASGVAINWWQLQGETPVVRQSLESFPSQVGSWRQVGPNERFPKETERVLRADDYLSRLYQSTEGRVTSFYVGYYASQRTGATYHSPLNCLPGSGWSMTDPARVMIQPTNGAPPFEANRYVVKKGRSQQVLIYWYQGRGRAVASEYWGKIYTIVDSMSRYRSDGAMVRVMTSIEGSEGEAIASAVDLAAQIAPRLESYIPN